MIEFTIKTLESINHHFSVEDETTVAQLKEQIREEMGIEIGMQRLIFCGRVLTDDRRLSEFDVNGKVIHLVPRPPPSPQWRNSAQEQRREMREAFQEAQRSLDPPSDLVIEQQQVQMMTPIAQRLETIRRTLDDIRQTLNALHAHMANATSGDATVPPPAEPMDIEHSPETDEAPAASEIPAVDEMAVGETPAGDAPAGEMPAGETPASETPVTEVPMIDAPRTEALPSETSATETTSDQRQEGEAMDSELYDSVTLPRPRVLLGNRPVPTRPRDLAALTNELDELHTEFAPFRTLYMDILRDTAVTRLQRNERVHRQRTMQLVCDVLHSFAHVYHAISDINVNIADRFPRLTTGFTLNRHPEFNHSGRRGDVFGAVGGVGPIPATVRATAQGPPTVTYRAFRTNGAGAPGAADAAAAARAAGLVELPAYITAGLRGGPFGGTNPAGRNTQAQPAPITYQVEIETRVPIALPIDTALLNGLAAVATNLQQSQNSQQNQASQQGSGQDQAQGQPQGQEQAQGQNVSQAGPDQAPNQASRPRVLMDIEQLLRAVSQANPGAEVVMTMEEIHPIGLQSAQAAPSGQRVPPGPTAPNAPNAPNTPNAPNATNAPNAPNPSNAQDAPNAQRVPPAPGPGFSTIFTASPMMPGAEEANYGYVNAPGNQGVRLGEMSARSGPGVGTILSIPLDPVTGAMPEGQFGTGSIQYFGPSAADIFGPALAAGFGPGFAQSFRPGSGQGFGPSTGTAPGAATGQANRAATGQAAGAATGQDNRTATGQAAGAATGQATRAATEQATGVATGQATKAATGQATAVGAGSDTGAGTGAGTGTGPGLSTGPCIGTGAGRGTGAAAAPPGGIRFQRPGTGTDHSSFTPVSGVSYGPATFTLQPDGGVFVAPLNQSGVGMTGDVLQTVLNSMFRAPTTAPVTSATITVTGITPAQPTTVRSTPAQPGRPGPTSGPNARANATPTRTTTGRTSDGTWGMGMGPDYPNLSRMENVNIGLERLGPLSAIARARAVYDTRRRNAERLNNPQSPHTSRQSTSNARAHARAMDSIVYDPFLRCDSLHANRRLAERRAAYQELHNNRMRQRASRPTATDIDNLEGRNCHFDIRQMAVMMRLLNGPFSIEGRLNAFMVTVARVLYLEPNGRPRIYDSATSPREFLFVRVQMRDYVRRIMQAAAAASAGRDTMDAVVSIIMQDHRTFIERLGVHTPIDHQTAPISTIRTWLRSRIPAVIACVVCESATGPYVARFYSTLTQFYIDFCALIMQFCVEGFEGLRILHNAFIEQLTEDSEETGRDWVRLISRENLFAIQRTIDPQNSGGPRQRYDGVPRLRVCCLYLAGLRSVSNRLTQSQLSQLPHICERHQRSTMPLTTPPLMPPPPRGESPDTFESLPSMSIPSSDSSESSQTPNAEEDDSSSQIEDDSNDISEERNNLIHEEATNVSDTDTVSTTSHNSRNRSPVQTRSVGTSPRHDTPPVSTSRSGQNGQVTRNEQNGPGQAGALSPGQDSTQTSSSRSSPESMRFVPPVMILEHWGEEWVPVFTRDQRTQRERERPQEPYSDAYLSGMPSAKRRCVRASRPPTTLDGFINETAREVTDRTVSIDPTQLRGVIRDSVRSIVRTRAETSEDFVPVRYAATARFLDQNKENTKEPEKKIETLD